MMEFMSNIQQIVGQHIYALIQLIWETIALVINGVIDSIVCFFKACRHVYDSKDASLSVHNVPPTGNNNAKSLADSLWNCFIFGFICVVEDVWYNHFILGYVCNKIVEFIGEDMESAETIQSVFLIFHFIVVTLPILALSKILNFICYQDTAELTFKKFGLKKSVSTPISNQLADQTTSYILQVFYCAQAYAVKFLPLPNILQTILNIYHLSLLFSLYAFEYKWVHFGIPLHKRLLIISKKWPYYLGFGLPLAVFTTIFFSFTNSILVFGIAFPFYVISSSIADDQSHTYSHSINTFKVVDVLSDLTVTFVFSIFLGFK